MRRLIALAATAAALSAAGPALSATADTKVNRHQEAVGSVVHLGGSRFVVQDLDYDVQSEVRRQGNRRFNFTNARGVEFASVRKASGVRWDVFAAGHAEPIGHVDRVGKNHFAAYTDEGESVGDARGPAAIQAAASVLVVFD